MTANSFRNQPPARANSLRQQPDSRGHFGAFGGRYVAETLMPLILDLERAYRAAKADPAFPAAFDALLEHYVGPPRSPEVRRVGKGWGRTGRSRCSPDH